MDTFIETFPNERYVEYLNTLHNVSANNQSAITELGITNPFFKKTMVEREVGNTIKKKLESDSAQIFVLTGHAGDGKTGLLYQVLLSWNVMNAGDSLKQEDTITIPTGRLLKYIKDFSEFDPLERINCLKKACEGYNNGISTFLVANTGPLINCFASCFSEIAQRQLIEAIDSNSGQKMTYDGIPVTVINVATLDNSTFVKPYLYNLLSSNNWSACETCEKHTYCAIYNNRCLMYQSSDRVSDFIAKHYLYQQEHGEKLTIRQIVAHLGFSITAGLSCQNIKYSERAKFIFLFTNSFFGYRGLSVDRDALSMKAIGDIVRTAYEHKRLRADEALFIKNDLFSLFTEPVATLLYNAGIDAHFSKEWQLAVRRAYMMLNIDTSETKRKELLQDVFSPWFPRYLQLRNGESPSSGDKELIQDALQMIFTGSIVGKEKEIPITMMRENGVSQCVQLVYDSLAKKKIRIELVEATDYSKQKWYHIYMSVNGEIINTRLSLPLFNYFEEIRRGAIATDIDPMLSQGIDSLKAQIISYCEADKTEIELLVLTDVGWDTITAEQENANDWILR